VLNRGDRREPIYRDQQDRSGAGGSVANGVRALKSK
jgi:hypothetical protein